MHSLSSPFFRPHELFNWLFSVEEKDYDFHNSKGKISWQVSYEKIGGANANNFSSHNKSSSAEQQIRQEDDEDDGGDLLVGSRLEEEEEVLQYKLRTRIDIHKDTFQAVLPITKVGIRLQQSNFWRFCRIRVDLLSYDSKSTDKRDRYDRMAGKKLDGQQNPDL